MAFRVEFVEFELQYIDVNTRTAAARDMAETIVKIRTGCTIIRSSIERLAKRERMSE